MTTFETFVETKGKNVLVIGGGDTGNDCVGSAIRLGCKSVIQLEMMPEPPHERLDSNPWPEWPRVKKTDYGQNESIAVFGHDPRLYQTTVKEFIKDDKGNVKQVVIVSLESKQVEGRMQMVPVKGSEKTLDADIVLIAAGFVGCEDYVAKAFDVKLTPRGNVADENYQTNQNQLFRNLVYRRFERLCENLSERQSKTDSDFDESEKTGRRIAFK